MLLDRVLDREPCPSWQAYAERGGGRGLEVARGLDPAAVVAEVTAAGLRGRGGGGFPTGRKWQTVADNAGSRRPVVVVNGAEGEPGTFKDRTLLRTNPFKVLEGALIAARAVGAAEVLIALKASFERELANVDSAIGEMEDAGVTAGVDVQLVVGPGEYLFGEETALLEVVEGRQPFPRVTPPFRRGIDEPVGSDGDGATGGAADGRSGPPPSLVNNVETLANVPAILAAGAAEFRAVGTVESPGTILCTISGATMRDGVAEVAMGTTLREAIELIGGGAAPEHELVGAVSGVANRIVPADLFDTPLTYEDMQRIGSGLGAAGFMVFDDRTDPVAVAHGVASFLAVESCGQCEPCKRDGLAIADHLERLRASNGDERDVDGIVDRLSTVTDGARCYLASQQARVIGSVLAHFADEFDAHARGEREASLPLLVAPIVDIRGGRAIVDETQASKQPDWSHERTPSGSWPAALLGDTPVEVELSPRQPATGPAVASAAPSGARGGVRSPEPFAPLLALHADVERLLDDLPRHPCPQREGALDRLGRVVRRYHDVTERVLYPLADRKLTGADAATGAEAVELAFTDRGVAEGLLASIGAEPTSDHHAELEQLAETLRQEMALDTEVLVPELGARLDESELDDLTAALEEARLTSLEVA